MNRRNFLRGLITAAAGFAILPGAGRIWKAEKQVVRAIINPDYENATYEMSFISYHGNWKWLKDKHPMRFIQLRDGTLQVVLHPSEQPVPGVKVIHQPFALRFNTPEVDMNDPADVAAKHIPPFIIRGVPIT